MHSAPVRTRMPSASRMCLISSDTSSSSRRDQPRRLLDDGDLGAEAPEHLRELEADVAAADDDEMPGHAIERQHRGVGEKRHVVNAGHVGNERATADVDEDPRRGQLLVADTNGRPALRTGRVPE